jgi:hypothetical protein
VHARFGVQVLARKPQVENERLPISVRVFVSGYRDAERRLARAPRDPAPIVDGEAGRSGVVDMEEERAHGRDEFRKLVLIARRRNRPHPMEAALEGGFARFRPTRAIGRALIGFCLRDGRVAYIHIVRRDPSAIARLCRDLAVGVEKVRRATSRVGDVPFELLCARVVPVRSQIDQEPRHVHMASLRGLEFR